MSTFTNTFYRVDTFIYKEKLGYWSSAGSGPGGKTLEEAYTRVREEMAYLDLNNKKQLKNIKYKIEKIVTTTEVVEEISATESSFFILKTA
jgi:hypothetical protein